MKAHEIRQSFLDFFGNNGHRIVSSAPVVPQDDPTLLFTNAGMNQFKDVFLGTGSRPYKRAADAQKCIRVSGKHNDLEEVGHDTYHHTFFEMMGNWSFGDYYKEEAVAWAWELVTGVWGLPKDKLWATVFREDDEAEAVWKRTTDIRPSQIVRFDEKDNFWEMGATGPCGPCSEIHIDLGEAACDKKNHPDHTCAVNGGCARFIEIWNLVFIQYNREEDGTLVPLPKKHVDTGLGLERTVAVLQGKGSNYETDLFMPIIARAETLSGLSHGDPEVLPAFRVIADHIRALTFAITDGAIPSNEGRGYVIRRLIRRAARYGRRLGLHEPFMHRLVETVISVMGEAYPEIGERRGHTEHVIRAEEERFNEVLDRGIERFEEIASGVIERKGRRIPGEEVFRLYDTYGFPLDLTRLMAREKGLSVDEEGFERELEAQRERARQSGRFSRTDEGEWETVTEGEDSLFVGYETMNVRAVIRKRRREGDRISLILDRTPFYAEAGGQVGDKGTITGEGFRMRVEDTLRLGDRIIHTGMLEEGEGTALEVEASVDHDRRLSIARNHTATHLLHKSLKEVLGAHVNQAGSLVAPDRLRFDFNHFEAMTGEEIDEVERRVNEQIRLDQPVEKIETSLDEAKKQGATALFGEKYGENVRVVGIGDFSMELCGGTHLDRTGQIGYFRILREESVAAGVRRIEAVTGTEADRLLREEKKILLRTAGMLRCSPEEIEQRIAALSGERKELERRIRQMRKEKTSSAGGLLENRTMAGTVPVYTRAVKAGSLEELRAMGDLLREKMKSGVGFLGTVIDGKVSTVCVVTDDLIREKKLHAGELVKSAAASIGGSGGGKPHLAVAGAREVADWEKALDAGVEAVRAALEKT